jgi:amino acid transporter
MGLDIFGAGGIGDAIKTVAGVIGKFIPDKDLAEKGRQAIQEEASTLAQKAFDAGVAQSAQEFELAKAQIALDTAEATSSNFFISGWRPWLGWLSGTAFVLVIVGAIFAGCFIGVHIPPEVVPLCTILGTMVGGLAGIRGLEKWGGVAAGVPDIVKKAIAVTKGKK